VYVGIFLIVWDELLKHGRQSMLSIQKLRRKIHSCTYLWGLRFGALDDFATDLNFSF
jgi:hypothetical protein